MFYAVRAGREPGVYSTWAECQAQVKGFVQARYKKFPTEEEAWNFVNDTGDGGMSSSQSQEELPSSSEDATVAPQVQLALDGLRHTAMSLAEQGRQLSASIASLSSQIEAMQSALQLSVHQSSSPGKLTSSQTTSSQPTLTSKSTSARLSSSSTAFSSGDFVPLGKGVDPSFRPATVKRAFSSDAGSAQEGPRLKRGKTDSDVGGFTGKPFADSEGVSVYTDGACFNNGKNGAAAGIGVWWGHNNPDNVSERLSGRPTNNRAEIHAAVKAVMQAKKKGVNKLIIHTDSEFLINSITKWIKGWKKNGWVLTTGGPVVNREDFEKLDAALVGMSVKWVHVRGHMGDVGNESADRLANDGARQLLR